MNNNRHPLKMLISGCADISLASDEEFAALSPSEAKLLEEQLLLANAYVQMARCHLANARDRLEARKVSST